jgi:hypothetical protein
MPTAFFSSMLVNLSQFAGKDVPSIWKGVSSGSDLPLSKNI